MRTQKAVTIIQSMGGRFDGMINPAYPVAGVEYEDADRDGSADDSVAASAVGPARINLKAH